MDVESVLDNLVREERVRFVKDVPWKFAYGTAGFRDKGERLDRVVFRMGVLASLRSKVVQGAIGIVITASHNPAQDNGVKIVDPLGEMLDQNWEKYASEISNSSTDDLRSTLSEVIKDTGCDLTKKGQVIFARDTRPSGERLANHLVKALQLSGCEHIDYGVLTTPQLHYMVRCINTHGVYGEPTEEGYYKKLIAAFNQLLVEHSPKPKAVVRVDGANGVGAIKVTSLMQCMQRSHAYQFLDILVYNDGSTGELNLNCGADYVKTQQVAPCGLKFEVGERCASFDGDGDRIVYFYKGQSEKLQLLDGDKIATLVAGFIAERLKLINSDLSIGVVQTAYANGSATAYVKNTLQIPVVCTLTGVKYLHQKALEFDIGIYFEANGHGTVLFSQKAIGVFREASTSEGLSSEGREAAQQLLAVTALINQAVGDAISDLLLVEAILINKSWSVREWNATYKDLPNRQLKVKVKDRTIIRTCDFERQCTAPEGLQVEINKLVLNTARGRSFVRPSGTEDVVRIYAEADTQSAADSLAVLVARNVYELAGGIGDLPSLPGISPYKTQI